MRLSVAVCTFNRSESLQEMLQSLACADPVPQISWEVLVVDNNSTDDTAEMTRKFAETASFELKYVLEKRQGLSHARNAAVGCARGEIISFLDDDVIVTKTWLSRLNQAFSQYDAACVGGKVLVSSKIARPRWWRKEYDRVLGECDRGDKLLENDSSKPGELIGIGANLSFRASVFEKYGRFHPELGRIAGKLIGGEETEFVDRLLKNNEKGIYDPELLVYHAPSTGRLKPLYLMRWHYRGGEFDARREAEATRDSNITTWFGIPRWLYRKVLGCVWRLFKAAVFLQEREALHQLFMLCYQLGFARETKAQIKRESRGQKN